MISPSIPTVYNQFLQPALQLVPSARSFRDCPELPDLSWVAMGILRCLHEAPTGRGFLQTQRPQLEDCPDYSHYFHTLKSPRRLALVQEVNLKLVHELKTALPDELADFAQLNDFDIYAGDGHWHAAASHDPILDERAYATGHFYALDLRRRTLSHLTVAQGKKEHDMHALKRLTKETLRHGAPPGRKVLYVWDKAGIDFQFWQNLKSTAGIYFISVEKENMTPQVTGLNRWDTADPINAGVRGDQLIGTSNGVLLRRITYEIPQTGQTLVFLTSELTVPPGLIAHLYQRRWRIEKIFDCLKNKLNEKKSWATSLTAKSAQAQFLCLTHNLVRQVEEQAAKEGVVNQPDVDRRKNRLAEQKELTEKAGRVWPSTCQSLQKPVQYSVKLIRWLRSSILSRLLWTAALRNLSSLYATL